jgi:hypothetical protein
VVTGFSGTQPPILIAPGTDPADKTVIDLTGPSARIVDLQAPGAPPQAQLLQAPKPFTVTASQIGQVFAVALDNANLPNIYVAATSTYGLPIVVPDGDGHADRVKQGAPNASFMPGLFGPSDQGGSPGSIWRIDGTTGEVRLFANVMLDGVANSGPALGGLAFDARSNSLFVADRDTGMIHRFDLSGVDSGHFDHGTQGREAAGLTPIPFDPANRLDITSPQFKTDDPATWAYASRERRIFGLAVHAGRLYYAVAAGLQIWSVGIAPDGSFGSDARLEITVPPALGATEISKITFDDRGRMLLGERASPSGAYDFAALAQEGVGRVLRYAPVAAGEPGDPWQPVPDQYAIGFPLRLYRLARRSFKQGARRPGRWGTGAATLLQRYGSLEAALKAGRFLTMADALRLYRSIATMNKKGPLPSLRNQKPTWGRAAALAREWEPTCPQARRALQIGRCVERA